MRASRIGAALAVVTSLTATFAGADVVTVGAGLDNTLYEDPAGGLSNGQGVYLFTGRVGPNAGELLRRAVLAFDVAAHVPSGATINSVSLTLHMSKTVSGPNLATLHRLGADWGEGDSNAGTPGGAGTASATGDATWIHRFYDTDSWATPGGDFAPTASGTRMIDGVGFYVWSGSGMVADVQAWVDQPSDDHGWILLGNESISMTAKRFDSREISAESFRPALQIDFTFVPPLPPIPPAVPTASNWSAALLMAVFATVLIVGAGRGDSATLDSMDQ